MNINLGNFLGGAAGAGSDFISKDVSARRDNVLKMKLLSAELEQKAQVEKEKFNREKAVTPGALDALRSVGVKAGLGDMRFDPNMNQEEYKTTAGLMAHLMTTGVKAAQAAKNGMTVADMEKTLGIDSGIPDKSSWLNPTQVNLWKTRLQGEKPTPEAANSYRQMMAGRKLVDQLEKMRNEAIAEVYSGPAGGRLSNLVVAADQGANFPKAKAYVDFATANLAHLAHASGEVGRLAEGDIDRARPLAPELKVANGAAGLLFNATRENFTNSIETTEKLFPQLRRMMSNEAGGEGIRSQAEKKASNNTSTQTTSQGPDPYASMSLAQKLALASQHHEAYNKNIEKNRNGK